MNENQTTVNMKVRRYFRLSWVQRWWWWAPTCGDSAGSSVHSREHLNNWLQPNRWFWWCGWSKIDEGAMRDKTQTTTVINPTKLRRYKVAIVAVLHGFSIYFQWRDGVGWPALAKIRSIPSVADEVARNGNERRGGFWVEVWFLSVFNSSLLASLSLTRSQSL